MAFLPTALERTHTRLTSEYKASKAQLIPEKKALQAHKKAYKGKRKASREYMKASKELILAEIKVQNKIFLANRKADREQSNLTIALEAQIKIGLEKNVLISNYTDDLQLKRSQQHQEKALKQFQDMASADLKEKAIIKIQDAIRNKKQLIHSQQNILIK
jgi:hypothetical protein